VEEQSSLERLVLDRLEVAVFGLASDAQVTYANALGRRLLARGNPLQLARGCLTGKVSGAESIAAVMASVTRTGQARSFRVGALAFATMVPIEVAATAGQAEVIVLVTLLRRRIASVRQLMQLFGLTAAEAQLSRALAHGETASAYARTQGVAISTVRSQLRAALVKTGTKRQLDLVTLIWGIAPVRETCSQSNGTEAAVPLVVSKSFC
jgi:DNA-binding CsgD family transcriptional regulator